MLAAYMFFGCSAFALGCVVGAFALLGVQHGHLRFKD